MNIAFFGTPDYSLIILNKLYHAGYPIVCVVTKPPRPIGRKQMLTPTAVALWAQTHTTPVLTPDSDNQVYWKYQNEQKLIADVLAFKPELLVAADYTQKIPQDLIQQVPFGGLNVHPSLLPSYRGPAPVPWALLNGETVTGVSLVTLADEFDAGDVIAQEKEEILPTDMTAVLLERLFIKGADLLIATLPKYIKDTESYQLTANSFPESWYGRLSRDDGFEPWENIQKAMENADEARRIERKWRAFHPWPGLWTKKEEKRVKILKCHLAPLLVLDEIQEEGKKPTTAKIV